MDRLGAPHPRLAAALLAAALFGALGVAWRAGADPGHGWTVTAPGGALTARVTVDGDAFALTVLRGGRTVLSTPLGRGDASAARTSQDTLQETFATPAGKRREHTLAARRLKIVLPHGRAIELLVADDGVALRTTGAGHEVAAWQAPAGARAWLQTYRRDYEGPYEPAALRSAKAGDYGFPALLRSGDTWALLTESGLRRQAAAHLRVQHGILQVALPPHEAEPRTTPWRVAVIGDLATVVGSDLPLSLGRPAQIRDTSWITPGRVAWSWWSDRESPGDISRQRAFVREAAAYRWQYVLLDDGWAAAEVPRIARYAARRGVRVMVWTEWWKLRDPRRRAQLLDQWAAWGVAGVKVDFLLSDSAARMEIYDDIAHDAAQRKLAVVFHGCTVPRGIQRTWPNVLTMEAVEGAEREIPAQGAKAMDPRQDVNLVFTRNVIGSMDYTPVTFSARHRGSTDAHRLALAVAYESGLQHFADSPESYARHPQAAQVLTDVPTAWDDTRLLAGAPDRDAVIARRAGTTWWIGSVSATGSHEQTVPLSFLEPGRSYRLHLVRDDGHGGLAAEDRTVTSSDRLSVAVERNGGYTAELTAAG
jgi:hypothetical protein